MVSTAPKPPLRYARCCRSGLAWVVKQRETTSAPPQDKMTMSDSGPYLANANVVSRHVPADLQCETPCITTSKERWGREHPSSGASLWVVAEVLHKTAARNAPNNPADAGCGIDFRFTLPFSWCSVHLMTRSLLALAS